MAQQFQCGRKWKDRYGRTHAHGCLAQGDEPWEPPCPSCRGWYACNPVGKPDQEIAALGSLEGHELRRVKTGIDELDRVIGDPEAGEFGIVLGGLYLIAGSEGCGKTTLLLQAVGGFASEKRRVIYSSDEQSREELEHYYRRFNLPANQFVEVMGNCGDVYKIAERAKDIKAKLVIIDSLQTAYCDDCDAVEGSPTQIDNVIQYLTSTFKKNKIASFIVCHLNNMNEFAGTRKSRYLVDAKIYFTRHPLPMPQQTPEERAAGREPDPFDLLLADELKTPLRELSIDGKTRFGPGQDTAYLEMTREGMKPPSRAILRKMSKLELVEG